MTHQNQSSEIAAVVQLLAAEGFEGMANAMQVLLNEAVKLERAEYLNAAPYQRTEDRRSYANGFKDKTVNSRLGRLELRVPQTRDSEVYWASACRFLKLKCTGVTSSARSPHVECMA